MPVLPIPGRLRQEDNHKCNASLDYILRFYLKTTKTKKRNVDLVTKKRKNIKVIIIILGTRLKLMYFMLCLKANGHKNKEAILNPEILHG